MIEQTTVERWLQEMGLEYKPQAVEDPNEFRWALTFRGPNFTTLVAHRNVEWNHLVMQVGVNISDEHRQLLRELPSDQRDGFLFDLKLAFLQLPVGYRLEFSDESPDVPNRFSFAYNILEEAPEKAGFFRRNHQLQSAALLGVVMIQKLDRFRRWPGD